MNAHVETVISDFQLRQPLSNDPKVKTRSPYGHRDGAFIDESIPAVKTVKAYLETNSPSVMTDELDAALKEVMDMFMKVYAGDRNDWFTVCTFLGFPSSMISKVFVEKLQELRIAIAKEDETSISAIKAFLIKDAFGDMLANFLSIIEDKEKAEIEENLAFIAWAKDERYYTIGAKEGGPFDILDAITDEHPRKLRGFGFLSAWLVNDVAKANADIEKLLSSFRAGPGYYNIQLTLAKTKIEKMLLETGNLVLSPWHVDDEDVLERLGINMQ